MPRAADLPQEHIPKRLVLLPEHLVERERTVFGGKAHFLVVDALQTARKHPHAEVEGARTVRDDEDVDRAALEESARLLHGDAQDIVRRKARGGRPR